MSQYTQIQLFYNQLNNMADEIKTLIDKELFDYVIDKMELHSKLLLQIKLINKCTKFTDEEQKHINELKENVKNKEKENIDTLQKKMQQVKIELSKTNLRDKLQKAYNQIDAGASIIDVDDSYQT